MSEENNLYCTRDLTLAATLAAHKFYMRGIDFQLEGERPKPVGYFNFDNTKELEEAIEKFWQRRLSVEPIEFMTTVRALKAQVQNIYKSPRIDFNKFQNSQKREKNS